MELDDRSENSLERVPFVGESDDDSDRPWLRVHWQKTLFGLFVSIAVGFYAGFICRSLQESWIYSALFCGEALICACLAGIIQTYSLRKSVTSLSVYFVASAATAPFATWLRYKLWPLE